jgi:hypothetical protein
MARSFGGVRPWEVYPHFSESFLLLGVYIVDDTGIDLLFHELHIPIEGMKDLLGDIAPVTIGEPLKPFIEVYGKPLEIDLLGWRGRH